MKEAVEAERFEEAAALRDEANALSIESCNREVN